MVLLCQSADRREPPFPGEPHLTPLYSLDRAWDWCFGVGAWWRVHRSSAGGLGQEFVVPMGSAYHSDAFHGAPVRRVAGPLQLRPGAACQPRSQIVGTVMVAPTLRGQQVWNEARSWVTILFAAGSTRRSDIQSTMPLASKTSPKGTATVSPVSRSEMNKAGSNVIAGEPNPIAGRTKLRPANLR